MKKKMLIVWYLLFTLIALGLSAYLWLSKDIVSHPKIYHILASLSFLCLFYIGFLINRNIRSYKKKKTLKDKLLGTLQILILMAGFVLSSFIDGTKYPYFLSNYIISSFIIITWIHFLVGIIKYTGPESQA